jgi:hypothetical protein
MVRTSTYAFDQIQFWRLDKGLLEQGKLVLIEILAVQV